MVRTMFVIVKTTLWMVLTMLLTNMITFVIVRTILEQHFPIHFQYEKHPIVHFIIAHSSLLDSTQCNLCYEFQQSHGSWLTFHRALGFHHECQMK